MDNGTSAEQVLRRRKVGEAEKARSLTDGYVTQRRNVHSFPSTSIGGHALVQQGNNYYNFHSEQPEQTKYEILFKSLTFDRMDARRHNVATALPTTGEWLFSHGKFAAWLDNKQAVDHHGFLWIKGKPGSGKSTIMKTALAWAEGAFSKQVVICYFFNARSPHQLEKSSLGLYRSLLYQLLLAQPDIAPLFLARFHSKERDKKVEDWTEIELQNFLLEIVGSVDVPPTYIFIDALDEGDDDDIRQMITFFEDLGQRALSSYVWLRVCFSSRHYPYVSIRNGLSVVVEDQSEHTRDIEVYIQSKLHGDNSPPMNAFRQELLHKSAGVFLWVVLVVGVLNRTYDQGKGYGAMAKILHSIPRGLNLLFAEILSKTLEGIDECITLLQWTLYSMRPLTLAELYVAIQQKHAFPGMENVIIIEHESLDRYLLDCSRGLVELTRAQPPVVQLIHESVRDYLIETSVLTQRPIGACISNSSRPGSQASISHTVIAEGCLQELLYVCQKAPLTNKIFEQHPLAKYAAEYWWKHMQKTDEECNQNLLDLALSLLNNNTNLLTWVRIYDIEGVWSKPRFSLEESVLGLPLYYAALTGVPALVSSVLRCKVDVDARGGYYNNALQAASFHDYVKVVQILLDAGADVNAQGGDYGNALHAASSGGRERVVQMLIEAGADVNAQGGFTNNALHAASIRGHERVVQMLIEAGADVNTQCGVYGNALQAASIRGHERVVQMLIEAGADVNAQGGYYGNALYVASRGGHERVVQMLIEAGADVNAQGGDHGNALRAALRGGHERVVQMLIEAGADVNTQCGTYGNELQAASSGGHERVVLMLIEAGADVNAQGGYYGNALQAASSGGHERVILMLIEAGADVNAQGGYYGNALHAASSEGHERVVQMLIEAGADINFRGGYQGNALVVASENDHGKVV